MLKILVPTDFSKNARNALNCAIEIANQAGGIVVPYYVYNVPRTTGSFISIERIMKQDAERDMDKLIQSIKPQINKNVILEGKIAEGTTISMIRSKAEKGDYDLVVIGTQGESGLKGRVLGSIAIGIMNRIETPVLAVPADAAFNPPKKIVLAMDDNPIETPDTVEILNDIRAVFDSEITIFHLEMDAADKGVDESVSNYIKDASFTSVKYAVNQNVSDVIDGFAKESNADILCLIRRKRGLLYEFLNPSVTKKEMFKSEIPILILRD